MLETVLTRIILRYAQRYICDTVRTDSLSLWGGELRLQNFELRTEELAKVLGSEESDLRLTRGSVRELRVVVPWNAIRSQSLRVEVQAVEVVFGSSSSQSSGTGSGGAGRETEQAATSPAAPAPPKDASQEVLDETSETWLQPLLRNVFGNVAVSADNLVAKLLRNGAAGCVTVARLDSKPHSPSWEAGFTQITGQQPTLYRVVSVRDVTVTLDHVPQGQNERRGLSGLLGMGGGRRPLRHSKTRPLRQVALPIMHRVSVEAFVEWPWLPWPAPAASLPTSRIGLHVSPVRARLTSDQAQLLAQLLRPEVLAGATSSISAAEADSESDRFSLLSVGCRQSQPDSSTTATAATEPTVAAGAAGGEVKTLSRQGSPLALGDCSPRIEGSASCPATPSSGYSTSGLSAGHMASLRTHAVSSGSLPENKTAEAPVPSTREADKGKSAVPEEKKVQQDSSETSQGGFRSFLADVLFGEDEDEEEAEEETDRGGGTASSPAPARETRRAMSVSACAPLLALTLEQSASPTLEESSLHSAFQTLVPWSSPGPTSSGLREPCWACTLSLVGISAAALSPPDGALEPVEGSAELHHVALHAPSTAGPGVAPLVALSWGMPLARSPLDVDDGASILPSATSTTSVGSAASSSSPASAAAASSKLAATESLRRAASWTEAGRRLLVTGAEFPHASHDVLGVSGMKVLPPTTRRIDEAEEAAGSTENECVTGGHAAVRVGLLLVPAALTAAGASLKESEFNNNSSDGSGVDSDEEPSQMQTVDAGVVDSEERLAKTSEVCRLSVQLSELRLCLEPSWCAAAINSLQPLLQTSGAAAPRPPPPANVVKETRYTEELVGDGTSSVMEVILCSAGLSTSLGPFDFKIGPTRADWRERSHDLDEAQLAAALRETTVFISGALPYIPGSTAIDPESSLMQLRLSTITLRHRIIEQGTTSSNKDEAVNETESQPMVELRDLVFAASLPGAQIAGSTEKLMVTHLEASLSSASLLAATRPLVLLQTWAYRMMAVGTGRARIIDLPEEGGVQELEGACNEPAISFELRALHAALRLAEYHLPEGNDRMEFTSSSFAAHTNSRRSDMESPPWPASSDSETDDASLDMSQAQAAQTSQRCGEHVLRAQQVLFSVSRIRLAYNEPHSGSSHSILASYNIQPQKEHVLAALSHATSKAYATTDLPDLAFAFACQLCPAALPAGMRACEPPPLQLFCGPEGGAYGEEALQSSGYFSNLCIAFLGALHIELEASWIAFAQSLSESLTVASQVTSAVFPQTGAATSTVSGMQQPTERIHQAAPVASNPQPTSNNSSEMLASLSLCALHATVLPSSLWLKSSGQPIACLTLPLLVATGLSVQADGLRFTVFEEKEEIEVQESTGGDDDSHLLQTMQFHSVQELQRCLAQAAAPSAPVTESSETQVPSGRCLDLARLNGSAWRAEASQCGVGDRPMVSLDVQLTISPLQLRVQPQQLSVLSEWVTSLSLASASDPPMPTSPPEQPPVTPQQSSAAPLPVQQEPRVYMALSLRAVASLEASLELEKGPDSNGSQASSSIHFRLPGILATLRHFTDPCRSRGSARLRLSRPHVVLASGGEAPSDNLEIIEWCEEKVVGGDEPQRRSAYWLVANSRWRGDHPLSLSISSLPLGLCVALSPLVTFASAFAAKVMVHTRSTAREGDEKCRSSLDQQPPQSRELERASSALTSSSAASQSGPRVQADLGAISLRLFPGDPRAPGAAYLVGCLTEASGCFMEGAVQARAVVSLSLFEQEASRSSVVEAAAAELATTACLVDDLLAPCAVVLCSSQPLESPEMTSGLSANDTAASATSSGACAGGGLMVELDAVHVDLGKRAQLCRLLRLCNEYIAVISTLPPQPEGVSSLPAQPESTITGGATSSPPSSVSSQEMGIAVHSITLRLPSAAVGEGKELTSLLSVAELRYSMASTPSGQRQSIQCDRVKANFMESRQVVEASKLSVVVLTGQPETLAVTDVTVSVDGGVSANFVTGRLFPDLSGLWPTSEELCEDERGPAQAQQPQPPEAAETGGGLKLRLLIAQLDLEMHPSAAEQRCLAFHLLGASVFSWPPAHTERRAGQQELPALMCQRTDLSVEVLSATATGPGAASKGVPLLSPMSFDGSVVTLSPEISGSLPARTELELCLSPMLIAAGAWQLGLIIDVASFSDPDKEDLQELDSGAHTGKQEQPQILQQPQLEVSEQSNRMLLDLRLEAEESSIGSSLSALKLSEADLSAMPEWWQSAARGDSVWLVPVLRSAPPSDLQPWQAARLPPAPAGARKRDSDAEASPTSCPCYALRLGCPARVAQIYVLRRGEAGTTSVDRLQVSEDYEVDAWDDALGRFIPVFGPQATGYELGDKVLASMAQTSCLLRLRLPALVREFHGLSERLSFGGRLLVELEVACNNSEATQLSVAVNVPRLTWSVLNSGSALPAAASSAPQLEEPFGDFSFFGVRIGVWQGSAEGMAIGATSERVGVDMYDMSNLSLVQLVVPEENHVEVAVRFAENERPTAVPLRTCLERRQLGGAGKPVIDVNLGAWRLAMPAWAAARLAQMGASLAQLGAAPAESPQVCSRMPVILRNGLPLDLVFGQDGAPEEVLALPAATQRAYAWRLTSSQRRLRFRLSGESGFTTLTLCGSELPAKDGASAWASLELQRVASASLHVCACVRRISCAQLEVELLPPMLVKSDLGYPLEFQLLGTMVMDPAGDVEQSKMDLTSRSDTPLCTANFIIAESHFSKDLPLAAQLSSHAPKTLCSDAAGEQLQQLHSSSLIGVLPIAAGSRVRFRAFGSSKEDWSLELPLSDGPLVQPFTTLLAIPGEGDAADSVLCTCNDIWAIPHEEDTAKPSPPAENVQLFAPGSEGAPLPQVLWLRPVLHFVNRCNMRMALVAKPLGKAVADPGMHAAFRGSRGDPRQLRDLELQVLSDDQSNGEGGDLPSMTTGQLLLSGLTQFPFAEANELVSWRNSVRCRRSCDNFQQAPVEEAFLLLELRRDRLSGLLRELAVEPMWRVQNNTGCEILFASQSSDDKQGAETSSHQPVLLHAASAGESWSSSLGSLQHDPSFPLTACFGVRSALQGGAICWMEEPCCCAMGQTTPVEIFEGARCFRMLVSVSARKQGGTPAKGAGAIDGGVQVSLYSGAYVHSKLPFLLGVQLGANKEELASSEVMQLPANEDQAPATVRSFQPIPWLPIGASSLLCNHAAAAPVPASDASGGTVEQDAGESAADASLGSGVILMMRLRTEDQTTGPWTDRMIMEMAGKASKAGGATPSARGGSATPSSGADAQSVGPAVANLYELLSAEGAGARRISGRHRDVMLDFPGGSTSASTLLNVAYHVHARGCLVLSLLPSEQPPLVCANYSSHTVWISKAWQGLQASAAHGANTPSMAAAASLTGSQQSWWRLVPGCNIELPCPLLRTLEVFPSSGAGAPDGQATSAVTSTSVAEAVMARLSLDPEATEESSAEGSWHLDVILGSEDCDLSWQLPLPGGTSASSQEDVPSLSVSLRFASGVTRVELRSGSEPSRETFGGPLGTAAVPSLLPCRGTPLPLSLDLTMCVEDLVVHVPAAAVEGRALALHAGSVSFNMRNEAECTEQGVQEEVRSRTPVSRQLMSFRAGLLSAAELTGALSQVSGSLAFIQGASTMNQVLAVPQLLVEAWLYQPSYSLPVSYELLRVDLGPDVTAYDAEGAIADERETPAVTVHLDDGLLELVQALAAEFEDEFAVKTSVEDSKGTPDKRNFTDDAALPVIGEEFRYVSLQEFSLPAVPLCADLRLSAPVFLSFTGLSLTFPEIRLTRVTSTSFVLGQELIAHCIAFLLLNSPVLLGSCDLFGNPVQAYRHLKSGLGDFLQRPLSEGLGSLAWHTASASLLSISAVCDSLRRNLPAAPGNAGASSGSAAAMVPGAAAASPFTSNSPLTATGEAGLAAGARALLDGVGRGLVGVVRWEQHTPAPDRLGALGTLRGARNAVAGAVAHPVGGLLDFVTAATRGLAEERVNSPGRHPADCKACLGAWPMRPSLDVSPVKFQLQCCQASPALGQIPAVLFWSPRCELVRVDGANESDGRAGEPNLRLERAGVLLTSAQLCVLVDSRTAHVLDIGEVKAVEEARGQPSALVTVASSAGRIWQLHVRGERGERNELVEHLRRARRLLGLPPVGAC
eukprot:TRINITY_DN28854_c0_g1_i1.p1 TRINITY_DN28854_c0_g1~~TRINITY_DN28854_c0_g1_i1.p1  ORF type:complete len:4156 (-),score=835.37 TRINITY_DN28854_c0_g1_i1:47-12514(-)